MNTTNRKWMVTGLFRDRESAERAYQALHERGYGASDVDLVMTDATRERQFPAPDTQLGSRAAEGAGVGAGIGSAIGAVLAGLAAVGTTVSLPGVGLVLAGPLVGLLAGAGAGGITGGLVGALIGAGIPQERARLYEEGLREGGILMRVTPRSAIDAEAIEQSWREARGEHVIGTGIGAGAGGLAGAGIGATAGPVGMAAGAAIGAVAGGLAGKGAAEVFYPKAGDEIEEHHFAKGVGVGSGAAVGAAVGAVGGPAGMAAGAAVGALAGGMAGKAVGRVVNPDEEAEYWRGAFHGATYYVAGYSFDDYGPAYELGYRARMRYPGQFEDEEHHLRDDWTIVKGKSRLSWEQAKAAVRAAWDKVEQAWDDGKR